MKDLTYRMSTLNSWTRPGEPLPAEVGGPDKLPFDSLGSLVPLAGK